MKKITEHIKSITVVAVLLALSCSIVKYFNNSFNLDFIDFIQALAGLFIFLFCIPVLLYRYNTNKRKKIMKNVSK